MKILSIDFDYFQNVTKEQISLCPDGVDNPTYLSEIIWGNHYAADGDELKKIGLLNDEYNSLISLLSKQKSDIPVMIANSHVNIYDFINENLSKGEELYIYNVDLHHDMINENEGLDCGNWIGYIMEERNALKLMTYFAWVHNPISLKMYGIEDLFAEYDLQNRLYSSVKRLSKKKFDAIFLCRSDTWTPPHLDEYFAKLCDTINKHFSSVDIKDEINEPRIIYKEIAEQIRKLIPA